ncbi:DUF167 domain-containing protein [Pseudolysinimonas sp.]|jgi:uncharacterized protein YggU (UPF0235/DUF167 family)|uniref:DUF167 domain-containing protein n=1 Tax=Pseudolysinimonas sp. TaxID=2680009 RepID=UPI0037846180
MAELVAVHVKPGSSKGPLVEEGPDGALIVYVRERAIEGAANDAVERAVAAHFGVSPSRVAIRRGRTSRRKMLEVVT